MTVATVSSKSSPVERDSVTDSDADAARGFTFPGDFEVTAFGAAIPEFEAILLGELTRAGVRPDLGSVRQRASSGGNYVAITIAFWCEDRGHYDNAYARLRSNPAVRWTL